jgi:Peptidase S46.
LAPTLAEDGQREHNYLRDGFYAKTQADEIKSTDLELNVLMSIEDVTRASQRFETRHDERSGFRLRATRPSLPLKRKAKIKPD